MELLRCQRISASVLFPSIAYSLYEIPMKLASAVLAKGALAAVHYIQKAIFVHVFVVYRTHAGTVSEKNEWQQIVELL